MGMKLFLASAFVIAAMAPLEFGEAPLGARSADAGEASDAKRRVNLSGRQRMLTQRMAKAACFASMDVERDMHVEMLRTARGDFDRALNALHFGDEALGVYGEEKTARVLRSLSIVEEQWIVFDEALAQMLTADRFDGAPAEAIYRNNVPLLVDMNKSVSFIEQAYANPGEMLLGAAVAINIAGRQRMLSQKIGKELCLITLGWNVDDVSEQLQKTVALFEGSHEALANGMPAAGVIPPPNAEIAGALGELKSLWLTMKPLVVAALEGESLAPEAVEDFARQNDVLLRDMHAIVGMYERS